MQDAIATDNEVCIRVGIPTTGGHLVKVARQSGYQTLFSANPFAKTYPKGHERAGEFWKFSMPNPEQFEGLDAALDSAGYSLDTNVDDMLRDLFTLLVAEMCLQVQQRRAGR